MAYPDSSQTIDEKKRNLGKLNGEQVSRRREKRTSKGGK
jgi:hypothetical protein